MIYIRIMIIHPYHDVEFFTDFARVTKTYSKLCIGAYNSKQIFCGFLNRHFF